MIARKQVGVSSGAALGRVVGPVAAGLSGVPDGLRGLQSEIPVSMAGGISLLSWSMAASRMRRGSMPMVRSRFPRCTAEGQANHKTAPTSANNLKSTSLTVLI